MSAMSIVLPAPAVVLGSSRDECRVSTVQNGKRHVGDRLQSGGVLCFVMSHSFAQPRRRVQRRGYRGGVLVRAQQDSLKKDEGNGLAGQLATDSLRTAAKVAPSHEGLAAHPSSGESFPDESPDGCIVDPQPPSEQKRVGSDLKTLARRFWKVAAPYWSSEDKVQARLRLGGVFALTLATTGISVGFNFLGRDFYNALASKDQEQFMKQLINYLGAFVVGIPVFVIRDFSRETLSLRWRAWMTKYYMSRYFKNRTFYNIQSQSLIDNPDQRIVDDLSAFTGTALAFALSLFNSTIDLISFSGILYGIYPPLFGVLIVYSLGGTAISVAIGKGLVGLNFMQEKREADFRYGLVRVRENAESIAFYGGEVNEIQLLLQRFKESFKNYRKLLIASRNLDFFTSGYRYLIQLLPAAVVAPLFFAGKIEFGVINQSFSAFNHVLGDFSVIVYQFQSLSAFSAVVDRLGEFSDILDQQNTQFEASEGDSPNEPDGSATTASTQISLIDATAQPANWENEEGQGQPLLQIHNLTLRTPQNTVTLVDNLSLGVNKGDHLLIMGPSGSGKTSLLRAIAGLWRSGDGTIKRYIQAEQPSNHADAAQGETSPGASSPPHQDRSNGAPTSSNLDLGGRLFFVPQRPYMVLGSLRQQLLYPTWSQHSTTTNDEESVPENKADSLPIFANTDTDTFNTADSVPSDEELIHVIENVRLGHLLTRCDGLDSQVEWSSILSLGEQQRLAFARLLLSRPALALMDESTSALDEDNEAHLYNLVEAAGVTFVSVGHRSTLRKYHTNLLQLSEFRDSAGCNWTLQPVQALSKAAVRSE